MNEPFDVELSRGLKAGLAKTLEDLEFTADMQRKVLERIRADEAANPLRDQRSTKRFKPTGLTRPLAWVAVAAAAFAVVARVNLTGFGSGASKTEAPMATRQAPAESTPSTVAPMPQPAPGNDPATFSSGTAGIQADDKDAGKGIPGAAESTQPNADQRMSSPTATSARSPLKLLMPTSTENEANPPGSVGKKLTGAPPGINALAGPERGSLGAAQGKLVLEIQDGGLRAVNTTGEQVWALPLEGVTTGSFLQVAADGQAAVTAGSNVHVLSNKGVLVRTLSFSAEVTALTWSADGHLAVAHGSRVTVYMGSGPSFQVDGVQQPTLAFGPDGSLALMTREEKQSSLWLYDRTGTRAFQILIPTHTGMGLTFTPTGDRIIAGGVAVDLKGTVLWHVPLCPEGVAEMGTPPITVAWDHQTVAGLSNGDGTEVWRAVLVGQPDDALRKVVVSRDGKRVAILAPTPGGAMLWVLDQNGMLIYTEKLDSMPIDAVFGDRLLVLQMPSGLQFRPLPQ